MSVPEMPSTIYSARSHYVLNYYYFPPKIIIFLSTNFIMCDKDMKDVRRHPVVTPMRFSAPSDDTPHSLLSRTEQISRKWLNAKDLLVNEPNRICFAHSSPIKRFLAISLPIYILKYSNKSPWGCLRGI